MSHTHRVIAAALTAAAVAVGPVTAAAAVTRPSEPIPGSYIASTNVPLHIEVGTRPVVIHDTVVTTTQADAVDITLAHPTEPGQKPQDIVRQLLRGPATHFAGRLSFTAAQVPGWGRQYWTFVVVLPMHSYPAVLNADAREHSLLALSTHRAGDRVTVNGSVRQLSRSLTNWVAWPGKAVNVQRWTRNGWVTVVVVPTDRHGNLTHTLHISWRIGLRLVDAATPAVWGQTTPAAAV